jgi:serine phosphatase RsbU (regulator of sigma subunit)
MSRWPGRLILAGLVIKLVNAVTGASVALLALLDRIGTAALMVGGSYVIYRLFKLTRGRLLWRVRRKLTLSYMFVGVVPVFLLVVFFALCGLLLLVNVGSYLVYSRLRDLRTEADLQSRTTALEIQRTRTEGLQTVLARRFATVQTRFPRASMAVVPAAGNPPCGVKGERQIASAAPPSQTPVFIGPWIHVSPPRTIPQWVSCDGFAAVLAYQSPGAGGDTHILVRAVAFAVDAMPAFAVVVDVPIDEGIVRQLREDTGIQLGSISLVQTDGGGPLTLAGRAPSSVTERGGSVQRNLLGSVAILDFTEWDRGGVGGVAISMGVSVPEMYARLTATQGRVANLNVGQLLLYLLAIVGVLFLVIEAIALIMGLALARSITGSVHALFEGTERARQGDFSHKIAVPTRDQLGELADSFNSMTASIEELLREMEKKKRLEEELRIAREIQMSLLPQGTQVMEGVSLAALCVPAREVGGDYYDFLPLGAQRMGVLIADVAGKGAFAALYMAELKGLVLALSKTYLSPRQLMIHANRIIAASLSSRSFITMTYAVIDAAARTMTYARAGHTPLIHVPAAAEGDHRARVLLSDGMVLGLKFDQGERFEQLLEEVTIPLTPGDLFVFFTDGISEAMNEHEDCYGEGRLSRFVEEHGYLPSEELRERILREIQTFVGGAAQHDDMTMILLKVDALASAARAVQGAADIDVSLAAARSGV